MVNSQTSNHFDYDVIIVGGGPAGSICAITVAKEGFSVVIIDKKERENIGDKTCGDAIDKAALQRINNEIGLDFPSGDEVATPIKTMSIAAGNINRKLSLKAPGYVLNRHEYGQRLLKEAEKLGVKIISRAPVRGIIVERFQNEKYVSGVEFIQDGKKEQLRSKFTIDASGAYAVIRKQLPDELLIDGITKMLKPEDVWPSYREIIELKDHDHQFENEILLLYKNEFPPPGYFWIFSKGNRRLNCGIGWMKYQSKELGAIKKAFLKEMKNYYSQDEYKVLKTGGGQIPVRPPFDSLVFNGGALAGDAACLVHPVTAEGHAPALNTGMHLGKALIEALKSNKRDKSSIWNYNIKVFEHYGKKHYQAIVMRKFLEKIGTSKLEYIIDKQLFKNEELDLIFSGGNLSLSLLEKIKRVSKLLLKPSLLLDFRRIFTEIEKCDSITTKYPSNPNELLIWRTERNKLLKVNY